MRLRPDIKCLIKTTTKEVLLFDKHFVGEDYGGGIIIQTWSGGTGGLIITTSNLSDDVYWGCTGVTISTTDDGLQNTINILNAFSTGYCSNHEIYAALLCWNYSGGGYTDWFLPSLAQLMTACGTGLLIPKPGVNDCIWSSTPFGIDYAWYVNIAPGWNCTDAHYIRGLPDHYLRLPAGVRACRYF